MEITLEMACPLCGKAHSVKVEEVDFEDYIDGVFAQDAFPYLTATEREQIISHFCPECQKSIFG